MTRHVVCIHGVSYEEDASGFSDAMRAEVERQAAQLNVAPPRWTEAVYSDLVDIPGGALTAPVEFFRDVQEYERNHPVQLKVLERVRSFVEGKRDCVVVCHSMGTVVGHDLLALSPSLDVGAFVTMGSPLGIDCKWIDFSWRATPARRWWPRAVPWVDLWDAGDPIHTGKIGALEVVKGAQGLRSVGYPCESRQVDVGCDPYTAHTGYWESTQAAALVLDLATRGAP